MSIRLVVDNTLPPQPSPIALETFGFAIGPLGIIANRNGEEVDAFVALHALADVVHRYCDDREAKTAAALSEPRGLI